MAERLLDLIKERDERVNAALRTVWDHIRNALRSPETPGDTETEPRRDEYGHTPDCPSGSQFLGEDTACRCAQTLAARTPGDAETEDRS